MSKRLLLIGYNYAPELTGIGKYSGEMMEWLAKKGYDCTVLTTYPYYPHWKVQEPYRKNRFWFKKELQNIGDNQTIAVYRCPMYIPSNPTGMKRMLSDFSFFISASIQLLGLLFQMKFDFIFAVAPSFQLGLLGVFYKKVRGSKLIYHIQDLQIEMANELGMIKSLVVVKFLLSIERFILKRCDFISTISEPMINRIVKKTENEVILFPNWADNTLFYPLGDKALLKSNFGYLPEHQVVLYSGAIGEKQGLETILEMANYYKSNKSLMFAICGTGPYKEKLQQKTKEMGLVNLRFFQLQPKEHFNAFLNMADLHLIIQKTKASDLILPSKLTSILAVGGIALLTADEGSYLHTLVTKHEIGIVVNSENQEALNKGLLEALDGDTSDVLKENALKYAQDYLNIDNVMKDFVQNVFPKEQYEPT